MKERGSFLQFPYAPSEINEEDDCRSTPMSRRIMERNQVSRPWLEESGYRFLLAPETRARLEGSE